MMVHETVEMRMASGRFLQVMEEGNLSFIIYHFRFSQPLWILKFFHDAEVDFIGI
jgi:hypothetical protein